MYSLLFDGQVGHSTTLVTDARPTRGRLFVATQVANEGQFTSRDWALFAAIGGIWGASFLFIALGLEAMPPGMVTFARVALGAAALSVLPRKHIKVASEDRFRMLTLSVVWVAIPFTLFPLAEQHINSSVTGLLNGATPIFAAVVATLFLKQAPRGPLLLGIVVGFVGITLISLPSLTEGSNEALGVVLVLAATLCYGFAVNIAPPLQARYGPVNLMAKLLATATILTAPYGLAGVDEVTFEWKAWLAVGVLGVVGTGVAFAFMAALVGRVGSTRASFITYLIPVVALGLGVVFQDDEVSPVALVGVVFVLAGALLASRRGATRR